MTASPSLDVDKLGQCLPALGVPECIPEAWDSYFYCAMCYGSSPGWGLVHVFGLPLALVCVLAFCDLIP